MSSNDPWNKSPSANAFGRQGAMIVPSDTADLATVAKAVTVTKAGTLAIIPAGNQDGGVITYDSVPVGFIPPYLVRRVKSTGTTATVASIDG